MHVVIWRYQVREEKREEFRRIYGEAGEWAALFRRAGGFIESRLLEDCDTPGHFVTLDIWADERSRARFLEDHGDAYARLDDATAHLANREKRVGTIVCGGWPF
ncbi:antibiotic biosynthesis monooxygenase [Sphingosinicella rhizophila]|uniref:Antibiotic biosynthesis monooxygenase n=1 Tax=Sphingosinicella rhizophila TaxID=3050082 RepID=A0ABU3QAA2_9SPHN|nr:antibiotic biosynthesis monooxygenase [Sphingosinicella sp. GR2756]MDT9600286.1 antibiotic biosynthesis monooxygenase [Sphingosinicella sp. GR2756]